MTEQRFNAIDEGRGFDCTRQTLNLDACLPRNVLNMQIRRDMCFIGRVAFTHLKLAGYQANDLVFNRELKSCQIVAVKSTFRRHFCRLDGWRRTVAWKDMVKIGIAFKIKPKIVALRMTRM